MIMTLHEQVVFLARILRLECLCVPSETSMCILRWPFHFPAYLKQTKSNSSDVLSFVNVCAGLKWVYFVHPVEPALDLLFCPLHSSTVALWTLYFFSFSSQSWWRIIFVQLINFLKNLKADCWMIRYFQLLFFLTWCFPLWPRAFVKEHSFC